MLLHFEDFQASPRLYLEQKFPQNCSTATEQLTYIIQICIK